MEDLAHYPGLFRRGNKWYVRKSVPVDLADYFSGDQIKRSLRTENKQKAMQVYHREMAALESKFETARLKKNNPDAHDLLSTYDDTGLLGLAYDWYTEASQKIERIKITKTKPIDDFDLKHAILEAKHELGLTVEAQNKNDYSLIRSTVQKWLKDREITYNPKSPVYKQFCYYLIRADIFIQRKAIAEKEGKELRGLPNIFSNIQGHIPFSKPSANGFQPSKIVKFSQLVERYINNDEKTGIEQKSKDPYLVLARRMREFFGRDLPIHEIDREMMEEFRGALLKYPTHAQKKYPGKTMLQAIKLADKEGNPNRLSIKSVNGQLIMVTALMNYAEKQTRWIEKTQRGECLWKIQ